MRKDVRNEIIRIGGDILIKVKWHELWDVQGKQYTIEKKG